MKIKVVSFVIVGAILALIVWSSVRFSRDPRSTANKIAGFNIPDNAQFIESRGDSNNVYFKWKLDPAIAATLTAPGV
jgi:cytochrome oxidase Cu insertion factor (SCO1/SenC/PrrC family)